MQLQHNYRKASKTSVTRIGAAETAISKASQTVTGRLAESPKAAKSQSQNKAKY